jgi:hypothetical protein
MKLGCRNGAPAWVMGCSPHCVNGTSPLIVIEESKNKQEKIEQ